MISNIINLFSSDFRLKNFLYKELKKKSKKQSKISVLDIGSSDFSRIQSFNIKNLELTLFDIKFFNGKNNDGTRKIIGNVLNIENFFKENEFDVVVALDLIEHIEKDDGKKLINKLIKISKDLIIIYTPNGFLPQKGTIDNPYQEHKSGWNIKDFKAFKFKVMGLLGHKIFRGEYHKLRKPFLINYLLSNLSFFLTNKIIPEKDAALLAIRSKTTINQ